MGLTDKQVGLTDKSLEQSPRGNNRQEKSGPKIEAAQRQRGRRRGLIPPDVRHERRCGKTARPATPELFRVGCVLPAAKAWTSLNLRHLARSFCARGKIPEWLRCLIRKLSRQQTRGQGKRNDSPCLPGDQILPLP